MREKLIKEDLRHELTESELADRGQQLAAAELEVVRIAVDEADFKAKIKARKGEQAKAISVLTEIVSKKAEIRDTECKIIYDSPKDGQCTFVRLDTGEVYNTRKMTEEEKQDSFDFEGAQTIN